MQSTHRAVLVVQSKTNAGHQCAELLSSPDGVTQDTSLESLTTTASGETATTAAATSAAPCTTTTAPLAALPLESVGSALCSLFQRPFVALDEARSLV